MKSKYFSHMNYKKNISGDPNSQRKIDTSSIKQIDITKKLSKINKGLRESVSSEKSNLQKLQSLPVGNITEEEENRLRTLKVIEGSNNLSNFHLKTKHLIHPRYKEKYIRLERFIQTCKKSYMEEEASMFENLPFKKGSSSLYPNQSVNNTSNFYSKKNDVIINTVEVNKKDSIQYDSNKMIIKKGIQKNSVFSDGRKSKQSNYNNSYEQLSKNRNSHVSAIKEPNNNENVNIEESKDNFVEIFDENKNKENDIFFNNEDINIESELPIPGIDSRRTLIKFKNVYDSFSEDDIEETTKKINRLIINIKGQFKRTWDYIMLILILYSTIITPFILSFNWECLPRASIIQIFIEIFYLLDICFNFFSQYYDERENIITIPNKIVCNYLNGWFSFDLITAIPFNLFRIIIFGWSNLYLGYSNYSFEGFLKWLKLLRLYKLVNYQELLEYRLINDNKINRVFKSTLIFIILTHMSSCIWIYIGYFEGNLDKNWITCNELDNSSAFDVYIASFYFHLVTIYTIGYGDIVGVNILEKSYLVFLLMIGVMLFSFGISSLSSLFGHDDNRTTLYNKKKSILEDINKEYYLEGELYQTIKTVLFHQYNTNNNEKYEFLDSLPTHLKNELTYLMYRALIKELRFFKNQSNDFVLYVLPFLKSQQLKKGDVLFSVGQFVEEMYLVVKGCLGIYLDPFYDNLEIGIVRENTHFGELLMQINEQSPYELKCKSTNAEVLILRKEDFINIKNSFNENIIEILKDSYNNLEIVDKRRQQFLRLYKFENSIMGVKRMMKELNMYLFERDFNSYYYFDKELENANDFILKNDFEKVSNIVYEYAKHRRPSEFVQTQKHMKSLKNYFALKCRKNSKKRSQRSLLQLNRKESFNDLNNSPVQMQISNPIDKSSKRVSILKQDNFLKREKGNSLVYQSLNPYKSDKDQEVNTRKSVQIKMKTSLLKAQDSNISFEHEKLEYETSKVSNNRSIFNDLNNMKTNSTSKGKTRKSSLKNIKRSQTILMENFKKKLYPGPNIELMKAENELNAKTFNLLNARKKLKNKKANSFLKNDIHNSSHQLLSNLINNRFHVSLNNVSNIEDCMLNRNFLLQKVNSVDNIVNNPSKTILIKDTIYELKKKESLEISLPIEVEIIQENVNFKDCIVENVNNFIIGVSSDDPLLINKGIISIPDILLNTKRRDAVLFRETRNRINSNLIPDVNLLSIIRENNLLTNSNFMDHVEDIPKLSRNKTYDKSRKKSNMQKKNLAKAKENDRRLDLIFSFLANKFT